MNNAYKTFLFELGCEELPAKQLLALQSALKNHTLELLDRVQLKFLGEVKVFATPRRLAILIADLQMQQEDQILERKGPSVKNAFDAQNKLTKAALGFAQSCGVLAENLQKKMTPQGEWLFAQQSIKGKSAIEILPDLMQQVLEKLPIPKPMRWGDYSYRFLRPVRWIVMMLDDQIIPAHFFGIATSNISHGHRFLSDPTVLIDHAKNYEALLHEKNVISDYSKRKKIIVEQLIKVAQDLNGTIYANENLLEEVNGLVEWPTAIAVNFDEKFLQLPDVVLITAMEVHQKCFAVKTLQNEKLLPIFLTVANILSSDTSFVKEGNSRVMQARLSDAAFFYEKDLSIPLASYEEDLKKVVFQAKLGSLFDKSKALADLATGIAAALGWNEEKISDTKTAALLAKCDLRTLMINEFPELQGEMGKTYAAAQGYDTAIANALFEQYLPRFSQDDLPQSDIGSLLALADRLLNLVGIFGIGQAPTGDSDPFALRRAAIAVCRILIENKILKDLPLLDLLNLAMSSWNKEGIFLNEKGVEETYHFIFDRLPAFYEEKNISANNVAAILNLSFSYLKNLTLYDIDLWIKAITELKKNYLTEALIIASVQKRIRNILRQEELGASETAEVNSDLFVFSEEKKLYEALESFHIPRKDALANKEYLSALKNIMTLSKPLDDFFAKVMVMVPEEALKKNRLSLLQQVSAHLEIMADFIILMSDVNLKN